MNHQTNKPTYLGRVVQVTGSSVSVKMSNSVSSGLAIIGGGAYKIGQVGSFVRIPQGYQDLLGIVSEVGADSKPERLVLEDVDDFRWMTVQLVGESIGSTFERGISQYPNINDEVHILVEKDLVKIYGSVSASHISVGRLASAEGIETKIEIDKLITRHSAILGSTGSGKSTTVASILRSISMNKAASFPSARVVLLDIHGEYSSALGDVAKVYRINPYKNENELYIPFWALNTNDLLGFLCGSLGDDKSLILRDKIVELKNKLLKEKGVSFPGVEPNSLTADTPIPFSLKQLWYDLIDQEIMTLEGSNRNEPALIKEGDADQLLPPEYKPHGMGAAGPYINTAAPGLKRQLERMKSRMLDHSYDFMLHPGPWDPDLKGKTESDLDELLKNWLGHEKPITILDLSGVPSDVLIRLIGALLELIYEALFWSRDKSEGGINRPLLIVMEEAHRYLKSGTSGTALQVAGRIVKEGRKYGIGAMIVSQRPSEVDETVLSQCGTHISLRLSNPADRARVKGTMPDGLASLMDMLPALRTGEAIITGEAASLPMRSRIFLPPEDKRPNSEDPQVAERWSIKRIAEDYGQVIVSWRAQSPRRVKNPIEIARELVDDTGGEE